MEIRLEQKQSWAFHTEATELLYGGAAGGMKSYYLRVSAMRWCLEVAGIQVYLFRRTLPDLRDNHLRGPTSLHVLLGEHLASGTVKYRSVENEFEFSNGAILHLCYCDSENDVEKYRGAEIHVLLIDELTHFTEYQYRFLRSRVRRAGLNVPAQYAKRLPRIEAASNPGSVGHAWVKRTWITPKPFLEVWRAPASEGGMLRQFIPAKLSDNPYLTRDDPEYADRLRGLGSNSLVRAMLEGDWDIIAGQAFEKLRRDVHGLEPFKPPEDWLCFGSFDWGSTRPFSFGLWTVSNGNELPNGGLYRRGSMIRYDEWYGWTGKANEGLRMEVREVAQGIEKLTDGRRLSYIVADPSIWKVDGGPSIAETMMKNGIIMRRGDNSRHTGYVEVRNRIAGDAEGPMLYATTNCHAGFWRTMPDIVMDEHRFGLKSEDVDTDQEDHCFAAGTMVLTASGPQPIDEVERATVLTTQGWRQADRTPARIAPCIKLTYDSGSSVVCTPDHKFLTAKGWVPAVDLLDEVSYNVLFERGVSWLQSLAKRVRNFSEFVIGCVDFITNARGFGYIGPCGNTTEARYPKDSTFTTSTGTEPTTGSKISTLLSSLNTYPITPKNRNTLLGKKPCARARESGTEVKRGGSGTLSKPRNMLRWLTQKPLRSVVKIVAKLFWRARLSRIALSIATLTASKGRCISVEKAPSQPVYCLHVPGVHNFALADGSIVHNCYDDVRMACMSRPWTQNLTKPEPKKDSWFRFEEKEEETWRTA